MWDSRAHWAHRIMCYRGPTLSRASKLSEWVDCMVDCTVKVRTSERLCAACLLWTNPAGAGFLRWFLPGELEWRTHAGEPYCHNVLKLIPTPSPLITVSAKERSGPTMVYWLGAGNDNNNVIGSAKQQHTYSSGIYHRCIYIYIHTPTLVYSFCTR